MRSRRTNWLFTAGSCCVRRRNGGRDRERQVWENVRSGDRPFSRVPRKGHQNGRQRDGPAFPANVIADRPKRKTAARFELSSTRNLWTVKLFRMRQLGERIRKRKPIRSHIPRGKGHWFLLRGKRLLNVQSYKYSVCLF